MDKEIYICDEEGIERKMSILLTYESNGKEYVLVQSEDDEQEVFAFSYDNEGNLFPLETEEEEKVAMEVLSTFQEDEEDA